MSLVKVNDLSCKMSRTISALAAKGRDKRGESSMLCEGRKPRLALRLQMGEEHFRSESTRRERELLAAEAYSPKPQLTVAQTK